VNNEARVAAWHRSAFESYDDGPYDECPECGLYLELKDGDLVCPECMECPT